MLATLTRSPRYRWYAFGAVAIGTFGSVVDYGSVSVAMPSIATHFHTDIPSVQWVVIGFAVAIIALLLPMGRLADLIGLKRVYIIGSLVFIAGAVAAGIAPNLPALVLARVVQGAGAAMTQGTGMAIVVAAFPPSERGKAIGLIMTMVGTGAIAGPALGGVLVDALGWRSVFFANIPIVALSVATGLAVLRTSREESASGNAGRSRFDWLGAAMSSGALVLFLVAITNAHRAGWASPPILAVMGGVAALLAAFVWWELQYASPMLQLRFFRRRNFSLGVSANFLIFLGASAVLFMTPFYLQNVLDYSPRIAGLAVVPGAACMALVGPLSGRLSDRFGWRKFTVGGLCLSVSGILILSQQTEGSSLLTVVPALMLQSTGMGVFYSPNTSSVLSAVERESYGVISAFLNLIRNAGSVISIAAATAVVTATMGSLGFEPSLDAVRGATGSGIEEAFTTGLKYAYLTMVGCLLLAMVISALPLDRALGQERGATSGEGD